MKEGDRTNKITIFKTSLKKLNYSLILVGIIINFFSLNYVRPPSYGYPETMLLVVPVSIIAVAFLPFAFTREDL